MGMGWEGPGGKVCMFEATFRHLREEDPVIEQGGRKCVLDLFLASEIQRGREHLSSSVTSSHLSLNVPSGSQ